METNGIVFVRNFLSSEEVNSIRTFIESSVANDLNERNLAGQLYGRFQGSAGVTHNNQGKHVITDFFGQCQMLDLAVGRIFEDPRISSLLKFVGGENLKLRGYNTRRMNGSLEFSAMEWHRDNVGEITIGILLNESGKTNDSATCFIPGSHLFPYCPFKEAQFTMPLPVPMKPKHERLFSSWLESKTTSSSQDAQGEPGDLYIFLGDLWHGRRPNFIGNHDMVFFIGLFPTEIPFPAHSEVVIPAEDVLQKLPPTLRRLVDYKNTPLNKEKTSYIYELQKKKINYSFLSLWNFVKLEIQFWKKVNEMLADLQKQLQKIENFYLRVVRKIRRSFFTNN